MSWLRDRLNELPGKSKSGLARALGVAPARISEIQRGVRKIQQEEWETMARYLEMTVSDLHTKVATLHSANTHSGGVKLRRKHAEIERLAPLPVPDQANVPIREALENASGAGDFMVCRRIIDRIASPQAGEKSFAFYVPSDDAAPAYERGDRVLVNPDLPVVPHKDVLLLCESDSEGRQAGMIRRIVDIQGDAWVVLRYARHGASLRPQTARLSRKEWPLAYRIVGLWKT